MEISTSVEELLRKPYSWNLVRQLDGSWVAEIREIPGCYVQGDNPQQALDALNVHARELLEVYMKEGKRIPPPLEGQYSGHFALRMPKHLHRQAAISAHDHGVSLNQFIVSAVAMSVGAQLAAPQGLFAFVRLPSTWTSGSAMTISGSTPQGGTTLSPLEFIPDRRVPSARD